DDPATMHFRGSNICSGPITLNNFCRFHNVDWGDLYDPDIVLAGVISGPGSLHKSGIGGLHFTGFGGNTFTGGLYCEEGFTYLEKSASAPALAGPLVVGNAAANGQWIFVEVMQLNQIPNNLPISLLDYGALSAENGVSDTLGPIEFAGGVIMGSTGTFTLAGDITNHVSFSDITGMYGNVTLSGAARIFHCDAGSALNVGSPLAGSSALTKTGAGELLLMGACTYSGATQVKEGKLTLSQNGRPGSTAASTTIEANGVLYLDGVNVTNESLVLYGGGTDKNVALIHHNTNNSSGPVEIHGGTAIQADPVAKLSIIGAITGDGGMTHFGDGTLVLAGSADNTFDGPMTFRMGTLMLSKPGAFAAIPNSLILGYPTNGAPP